MKLEAKSSLPIPIRIKKKLYLIFITKNQTKMKILKTIGLIILLLIASLLITALFTNKDYAVTRNIQINKPKQVVFDYLKLLKNQDNWSVWSKMDPKQIKTYEGTDGTVGFISKWKGDVTGEGQQKIIAIDEGNKIDYELKFIKPFESTSPTSMFTTTISDSVTDVKWTMSGHMAYPSNAMLLFMNMEKQLGTDFEVGLKSLKGILEK